MNAPVTVGSRPWWLPVAASSAEVPSLTQTWLDLTAVRVPVTAPRPKGATA